MDADGGPAGRQGVDGGAGASPASAALGAAQFRNPPILLAGTVDYDLYKRFREQLDAAPQSGVVSVEMSTLGGDPEVARMMGEDIRFHSEVDLERRFVFLGKAAVYSAGVTFMSFFARPNRYLTRGTRLMIHERKLDEALTLNGPLSTCLAPLRAKLNEVEHSIRIQNEGFANLVKGSRVSMDDLLKRAPDNWYLEAREALDLGLVERVI
jgi:ATP-dependent protease ClpP protease subunit